MASYMHQEQEERFVDEYMTDFNGTQAAIRAGYSPASAASQASRLLKKARVASRIAELQAAESRRLGISKERLLNELAKIGFANIEDVADIDSAGIKDGAGRNETAAVASIRVKRTTGPYGDSVEREIKMYDKQRALEALGKNLGLFDANNNLNVNATVQIVDDIPVGDSQDG